MIIRICAFTDAGRRLAQTIESCFPEHRIEHRAMQEKLSDWTVKAFSMHVPIVFIGACGIAVRAIAPFAKDKLMDSPVVVLDEAGQFVIPILSGHMGGANELAEEIADKIGAQAVITTATDVNGVFSVDVFAEKNGFKICNRDGIRRVSSKLLREGKVLISIAPEIVYDAKKVPPEIKVVDFPPAEDTDVVIAEDACDPVSCGEEQSCQGKESLRLVPKKYVLGIGCKKDTPVEKIRRLVEEAVIGSNLQIDYEDIAAVASIDLKAREYGLLRFASEKKIALKTYSCEQLRSVRGEFTESEFVKNVTGVSNVCERAAICCAGEGAKLLLKKVARDGVTVAVAMRKGNITEWKT